MTTTMTPLERDAIPGALLDPLIARLKGRWFSTTEIPVIISALTKCREALSSAHAQEAAEQSLIEEAAFIRRQETDRASPAQAPTGGAGALELLAAICEVDTRYMHSDMTDADYVLLLSPHIEDARKVLAEGASRAGHVTDLTDRIIAGVLFDFCGFLTTHKTRWKFSAYDEAPPAVDAIRQFAALRSIATGDLDEAVVQWRTALAAGIPAAPEASCNTCKGLGYTDPGDPETGATSLDYPCPDCGPSIPAAPAVEAVAWYSAGGDDMEWGDRPPVWGGNWKPLYATPAQPTAVEAEPCDLPPIGWRCTRGKGHEGPCAAIERVLSGKDAS